MKRERTQTARAASAATPQAKTQSKNKKSLFKSFGFWFTLVVVLLVAFRIALPSILRVVINDELDDLGGYHGSIEDVDLAIWRGNYGIEGFHIAKMLASGRLDTPLVTIDRVDFSIDWEALLDRHIESSIYITHPVVSFTDFSDAKEAKKTTKEVANKKTEDEKKPDEKKHEKNWQDKLLALAPFQINHFEITDGAVRFRDPKQSPPIKIDLTKLHLTISNISNTLRSADQLPTVATLDGRLMNSGVIKANAKLNLLQKPLEGQIKLSVRGFHLAEINDFARAYGKFDFKNGDLDVTLEAAASKVAYEGYVKTLMKNIDVLNWKEERAKGASVGHLLWEGVVGTIVDIFKNHKKDQFAARIPLKGPRSDLETSKWSTVGSVLRNAFIMALSPKFEDDVSFKDVSPKKGPAVPPKNP